MPFRETQSLLGNDPGNQIAFSKEKQYLLKVNWRTVSLAIVSALIPFLLWLLIFQVYDDPLADPTPPPPPPLLINNESKQAAEDLPKNLLFLPWNQASNYSYSTLNNDTTWNKYLNHDNFSNSSSLKMSFDWNNNKSSNFSELPNSKLSKIVFNSNTTTKKSKPKQHPDPDIVSQSTVGNITIYNYNFVVTPGTVCPDNFPQPGYLINGQTPGPEIRIKQHSILIVHVTNRLSSELTIHFHGIHQRKSFMSDGVPHVTQKPIPPGGSFTYEIDTWPQVGTFFYHAHTAMDIVWLYGPLIVEDDPESLKSLPEEYHYDEDRVFILNGVYHEGLDQLMERIAGPIHHYPAETSSITFNGRSYGIWNDTDDKCELANSTGYFITNVEQGLKYRFRFINAASDSLLSCNFISHDMTIIEADGIYVEPVKVDHIVLSPGQRYSAIVVMDQEAGNYLVKCKQMDTPGPLNGVAILHYSSAPLPTEEELTMHYPGIEALPLDFWIVDKLKPNVKIGQIDLYDIPKTVDTEIIADVFEAIVGQQHVYLINGNFFQEPKIPYFMQLKQGLNISDPPQMFEIKEGENVQIVFQNQRTGDFCFSHPWHIHGHSFHVVGQGANRYDPVTDAQRIQEDIESGKKFQFRDSVTVYANQTEGEQTDGAFCGWAAVRFSAHNPGVWLVHCHITPHMVMGKKFLIWEHPQEDPFLSKMMNVKKRF